jgi:hypothetical protein
MARKRISKAIPAKGRLRDMADRLWSIAVRGDWGNKCAVCGAGKCEAHHLVPRQHEATRYELRNGVCLCAHCHQFDRDLSPHQNSAGWLEWLKWHHPTLADWYIENRRPQFDGTTNAAYFCDVIRRLGEYVEPDDFARIVGVKFSRYLLEATTNGGTA